MLQNVIDKREQPHCWRKIRAVLEPASHGAAYAVACDIQSAPVTREAVSIAEAIRWAGMQVWPVDLYLYDADVAPAI